MAINLTELFESIGRIGHTAYLINIAQAGQPPTFEELATEAWMNELWIVNLIQTYDTLIRSESVPMGQWQAAATNILLGMVALADPTFGGGVSNALGYIYNQMVAQGQTVKEAALGSSYTPFTTNIGSGNVCVVLVRADGMSLQNTVPETGQLSITADSFTGGATVGQEPWQYVGVPNLSSQGTGVPTGIWNWDWPTGSGVVVGGNCISALQNASASGNYLTNGAFSNWNATPAPSNWNLLTGIWGVTAQQSSTSLVTGGFSVQFNVGATNELTQQFGSSATTGAAAGTTVLPTSYAGYAFNIFLRSTGVMTGGVLTVSLVNAANNAVINDQAGNPQTFNINLSGLSSAEWTPFTIPFRLPTNPPENYQLALTTSTPPAGANLLLDCAAFCAPINLYVGGPNLAVFSNPSAPFHAVPLQDGWSVVLTNDRGGSQYLATMQALWNRLFQAPGLILPYAASPTLPDTLITNP
jgi:hypothetical protein